MASGHKSTFGAAPAVKVHLSWLLHSACRARRASEAVGGTLPPKRRTISEREAQKTNHESLTHKLEDEE